MKEKNDYDVGVIVGRFQVPELHDAHKDLINFVRGRHQRVIMILGLSAIQGTQNNPLDIASRKQMIQEVYPDIDVAYVKDKKDDNVWSYKLDETIKDLVGPNLKVLLYGSRDSFIRCYTGGFSTMELESDKLVSGTEIRKQMSVKAKPSYDWRAGAIWQTFNQYRKVYTTVDVAVYKADEILLAKKPGEKLFRFIGGFSDVNSPSFEDDARREVREEVGIEVGDIIYIGSFKIDDWRYRKEVDCIKTLFFMAPYQSGTVKAQDDIESATWFKLDTIKAEDLEPEHRPLFEKLKLDLF